jgi:hypothetical protein
MNDEQDAFFRSIADLVLERMASGDRAQSIQVLENVAFVLGGAIANFCEGDEELGELVVQRMCRKVRKARAEVVEATIGQRLLREGYEQ